MILLETLLQDLRYGASLLLRDGGFTAVAVFALAIGIGVNTAAFTAYKATVTRPLDARDPAGIVNLALIRDSGVTDPLVSYPDYEAYRDQLHSFSGIIAFTVDHMRLSNAGSFISQRSSLASSPLGGMARPGAINAEFASVFIVSENYFPVLGVAALRGRTFDSITPRGLSASPAVLISENYWQKRFAGDPSILGRTIRLNGAAFTVIGITPHDFVGTNVFVPDFWLPLSLEPLVHPGSNWLRDRENECCRLFARLAPGVSIGQAQAEMTLLSNHLRTLHDPRSHSAKPTTALVWPGSPFPLPLKLYSGLQLAILLIMSAAGMVLAVACANVASLQLARATGRQKELGMRLSLGASRMRVVRQLLTESTLLGLLAGACALPVTWALTDVLAAMYANAVPPEDGTLVFHVTPDMGVFLYVLAISLTAGLLFGLAPAMESSRSALSSAFQASAGTSPARSRRLRDLLITVQVALSLTLMIAGSLFIHSAMQALNVDPGYDSKHVVDINLQFSEESRYSAARKVGLVRDIRARLGALPGVAAITSARPPSDGSFETAVSAQNVQSIFHYSYVQANYFQTLGIPLFLGRDFESQAGQPERSIILSESAAKQLWPGQNPIGHSLRLGAVDEQFHNTRELIADGPTYQVVGVSRDTRGWELDRSDSALIYLPLPEDRLPDHSILIRIRSDPARFMNALDPIISAIDPSVLVSFSSLQEANRRTPPFFISSLSAAFASVVGLLGLLLALMGIYGTVSYIVVLRTREVGIRRAVGAQRHDILTLILRESMQPVLFGSLAGVILAVGVSFLLRGILFGLGAIDGISVAGVSVLFMAITLLAAYPPSRRAMRVDPMVALRYE